MNLLDLLLSRMMVFDEESGGGSGDNEETTQTPKDMMKELDEMMEGDKGGSETPKTPVADEIELEVGDEAGVEGDLELPVESKEEKKKLVGEEAKEAVEKVKKEEVSEADEIRKDMLAFAATQLRSAGITPEDALTGEGEEKVVEKVIEKVEEPTPVKDIKVKPLEISDELWEKVKDDKDAFAELINGIQDRVASAVKEQVLLDAIPTVQKYSRNYITSVNQVETFYRENPELNSFRPVVGFISAKLAQEKPDLDKGELMKQTEKEAYRLLRLTKGKTPPDNGVAGKTKPPAFGETGTRRGKPGEKVFKNKMQKELDEMSSIDK